MPAAHVSQIPISSSADICRPAALGADKVRSYSAEKLPLARQHNMHRYYFHGSAFPEGGHHPGDRFLMDRSHRGMSTDRLSNLPCTCSTAVANAPPFAYEIRNVSSSNRPFTDSTVWLPRNSASPAGFARSAGLHIQKNLSASNSFMYNETRRKRNYRIAVNLFNKDPKRGLQFLIDWGFVAPTPASVARFLLTRKGLSKQMIGNYVGNIQDEFCSAVLKCMAQQMDLCSLDLDVALRHFLYYFRLPGEAQKIERIIEAFAERYCQCNAAIVGTLPQQTDAIFILAFAIIMLNTDLHSPNVKPQKRMKREDFIKNLQGLDEGRIMNPVLLADIYERIKAQELRTGSDHITQVLKVDRRVLGDDKPTLALPHRRLICYIRLTEVLDPTRKQSATAHQREAFLFNDLIMLTKVVPKKKDKLLFQYRDSYKVNSLQVGPFSTVVYPYGIRIRVADGYNQKLLHFNATCAEDRRRFLEDLDEAIQECREMDAILNDLQLIDEEVKKSRRTVSQAHENRDSGLPDVCCETSTYGMSTSSGDLQILESPVRESVRKAISNTSVDSGLAENHMDKGQPTVQRTH